MVSNGAQMILEDIKSKGISLTDLDKHVCIASMIHNPSMVILDDPSSYERRTYNEAGY